jgi:hypothetical protein
MGKDTRLVFADEELRNKFNALSEGKNEEQKLYKMLRHAFEQLKKNPRCGVRIQKKLWPKEYAKSYNLKNLFKYNLPNGWRMAYTTKEDEVLIVAIVLEWFKHKDYERRFGYG